MEGNYANAKVSVREIWKGTHYITIINILMPICRQQNLYHMIWMHAYLPWHCWWLVELTKRFTMATHKCVSLFWWTFFGTCSAPRSRINVLNIYACPRLNVEMNLRGVARKLNQRKNWINGKFESAILSFWVLKGHSSFPSVGALVSAITENGKNGCSSPKMRPRSKLPITDPLKFGSLVFQVLTEMQNWCQPLWKMGKMAVAPQKHVLEQNFQLLTP